MSSPSMLADPLREIGETVEGIKEALGIAETDHAYYVAGGAPGDLRGLRDFAVQEMRRELCFEAEKPTKHDVAEQLLTLAKLNDAHVLRFLRVSRFKPREAIARAVAYCRWEREQMMLPADLGADPLLPPPRRKPSQPGSMPPALLLRPLLESGCLSILPTPAVDGSAVLLSDLRQAEAMLDEFSVRDIVLCGHFVLDQLSLDEDAQVAGVTLVQDLSSASWQLLARFAGRFDVHRLQKERARAMGDAVPLRFRRMFLIDAPWYFAALWRLLSHFEPQMAESVTLISRAELGEKLNVPLAELPVAFGGTNAGYMPSWWIKSRLDAESAQRTAE